MNTVVSHITSLTIVYSIAYLSADKKKTTSTLSVTGLCAGKSPETGEFPAQRASNAENISIWWRHHDWTPSLCPHGPTVGYCSGHPSSDIQTDGPDGLFFSATAAVCWLTGTRIGTISSGLMSYLLTSPLSASITVITVPGFLVVLLKNYWILASKNMMIREKTRVYNLETFFFISERSWPDYFTLR